MTILDKFGQAATCERTSMVARDRRQGKCQRGNVGNCGNEGNASGHNCHQ